MPKQKPTITTTPNDDIQFMKNQEIFELSPEAIILIGEKGHIIKANQRLKEWLGYSPKEIIGTHVSKLPFISNKNKLFAVAQFAKRMAGQKILPYELEFIAKDKSKVIGIIHAVPIANDQGKNIIDLVMISDITERKKAENKLLNSAQELEKLNKLMMGREFKMSELKEKARGQSIKNKIVGTANLNSNWPFDSIREIAGILIQNLSIQVVTAVIAGIYVSLIIVLFLTIAPILALTITCFVLALGITTTWLIVSMQTRSHLRENKTKKAMLSLLEDIAEEKAYEKVRGKSILENIGEGIIITNEKGLIEYMNPAFEKFLGCLNKEVKNKDFAETIKMFDLKGKEIPVHERSDSAAVTAKNLQTKVLIKCKDGQKAASFNAAPIKVNDQFHGVVRIIHDISDDFKLQQQKDDFFSIASHELRTPLTVIAGNISMILQGYGNSKVNKKDRSLLIDAETAADRLISMVNEFLNVSRIDQGRIQTNIVELDACKLTNEVIKEIAPLAKEKKIKLDYSCPGGHEKVKADENLVKEILINLIGNSIKFTQKGGIHVSHEIKNGWLTTTVTDTGIGIAKDKHNKLFARFQQAMNRTMSREAGGTGLGLYISREFSRLMGGDLKLISSEEGKGSSFAFTLPVVSNSTIKTKVNN